MSFDLFPPIYENQVRTEASKKVADIQQQSESTIRRLESDISKKPKSEGSALWEGLCEGAVGGFTVGAIACTIMCAVGANAAEDAAFFICLIVGAIIGAVTYYNDARSYIEKCYRNNAMIQQEKEESPKRIEKAKSEAESKIAAYRTQFEEEAKKMSTQFADSQLAIEVIEWMTAGFTKTIAAADRRSHVERINIPFQFKVYREKITCNLGTFDFEIKRCRNLSNPLEQTALARAIASAIQLNITMKHPKDASGTDIITNISYSYEANNVTATLIYSADNGNYRAVQDWTSQ